MFTRILCFISCRLNILLFLCNTLTISLDIKFAVDPVSIIVINFVNSVLTIVAGAGPNLASSLLDICKQYIALRLNSLEINFYWSPWAVLVFFVFLTGQ